MSSLRSCYKFICSFPAGTSGISGAVGARIRNSVSASVVCRGNGRTLALVVGNGASGAESTDCNLELSTAVQGSGASVHRPCALQHLF